MNTRELFKRRVIELIHWLPYEEAINKDNPWFYAPRPITIWRVMKAFMKFRENFWYVFAIRPDWVFMKYDSLDRDYLFFDCQWKLTNEDWSECTDDDQTDETIERLYNLIK
jgi:hypothetical protein